MPKTEMIHIQGSVDQRATIGSFRVDPEMVRTAELRVLTVRRCDIEWGRRAKVHAIHHSCTRLVAAIISVRAAPVPDRGYGALRASDDNSGRGATSSSRTSPMNPLE